MNIRLIYSRLIFILLAGLMVFLTFNRHSRSGYFNYHSEIWADKAGYYVYLPAAFKYNFDPQKFPQNIDKETGDGFALTDKVLSKYTYGVAILQSPFYLLADILANATGYDKDGFSPVYHWAINVAAVFYLMFGLLFLFRYLRIELSAKVAYFTLISLFLGTNLFFYAIDETGMSHVYSFFLFSAFLYILQRSGFLSIPKIKYFIILGLISGLIILIRPTNIVFLLAIFYLRKGNVNFFQNFKLTIQMKKIWIIGLCSLLPFIPQLFYWQYAYGSYFTYSYSEEGFNWLKPMILQTWFSPNNGLFLYTPFYFILLAAFAYGINKKSIQTTAIAITFFGISYIFSAWHDWTFGCSFGGRSYVEYLALFAIPLGHLIKEISLSSIFKQFLFWFIVLIFIGYNLKMTYTYDECFPSVRSWDWHTYHHLLFSKTN